MECNDVKITIDDGRALIGTLCLYDNYNLELKSRPTLLRKAGIAVETAVDNPGEAVLAIAGSILQSVMNVRTHCKSELGRSISYNIEKEIQLLWMIRGTDILLLKKDKKDEKKLYILCEGKKYYLEFPSQAKLEKFFRKLDKIKDGIEVFIW